MIRRLGELSEEQKTAIHGGAGGATVRNYLANGEMTGVIGSGRITLEPGASIGEHPHPNSDEMYLVLEGRGVGVLNGQQFPVGPGDMYVLKAGGTHALINDSDEPLVFFMVITRGEE